MNSKLFDVSSILLPGIPAVYALGAYFPSLRNYFDDVSKAQSAASVAGPGIAILAFAALAGIVLYAFTIWVYEPLVLPSLYPPGNGSRQEPRSPVERPYWSVVLFANLAWALLLWLISRSGDKTTTATWGDFLLAAGAVVLIGASMKQGKDYFSFHPEVFARQESTCKTGHPPAGCSSDPRCCPVCSVPPACPGHHQPKCVPRATIV